MTRDLPKKSRDWNDDGSGYVRYLPSHSLITTDHWTQHFMPYYDEKSSWRYPYALVSAGIAVWEGSIHDECRISFPKDMYVLADSGGFTYMTQEVYIPPVAVIQWQEKFCSDAIILDHPPFEKLTDIGKPIPRRVFESHLEETIRDAGIMRDARTNKDMGLFGVIQGATDEEIGEWYDRMKSIGPWDGWAVSPKPITPPYIARYMRFCHENKMKRVHIFRGSGIDEMLVMVWLNQHMLHADLTYDSIVWIGAQKWGSILNPLTFRHHDEFRRGYSDDPLLTVCGCPFCTQRKVITQERFKKKDWSYETFGNYNNHNVWWSWFLTEAFLQYSKNEDFFREIVRSIANNPEAVFAAMDGDDKRSVLDFD